MKTYRLIERTREGNIETLVQANSYAKAAAIYFNVPVNEVRSCGNRCLTQYLIDFKSENSPLNFRMVDMHRD